MIKVLLVFSFIFSVAQAFTVPPLTGPVVDQAGVLSPSAHQQIENLIRSFHQSGKAQIQVLIVKTLNEEPIEQASIQVVDQWKLGTGKADNGVLFMVAIDDRKLRIEVGQGLEGDLPDAYASRIIRELVTPYFKQGRYEDGIAAGVAAIANTIDPNFKEFIPTDNRPRQEKPKNSMRTLMFLLFLLFIISRFGGRGGRGGFGRGLLAGAVAGSLSRGGGWGGGGGGGWSGGGGGFSGGGASGNW